MTKDHKPLPVEGYTTQSDAKVSLVNQFKQDEERLLRKIDVCSHLLDAHPYEPEKNRPLLDARWAAIARTHFQEGFMCLTRAVFQPTRIKLPDDD